MSASVRSSGAATLSNTTTSVTVSVPGDVQVGDVVYTVCVNGGASSAPSSVPSGWSLVASVGTSSGTTFWGGVYRIVWPGGGQDTTPTWSGFTNSCTACCVVVQGADTSSAPERDTSARANTNGSGCNGVDANAGDLILAFAAVDDDAGTTSNWACATNPTTLSQVRTQVSSGGTDTLVSVAQGAKTTTGNTGALSYTVAGSDDNTGLLVVVKSPAASPPAEGSASGLLVRSGSAGGVRVPNGAPSGTVNRVGSAAGSAPIMPLSGSAVGTVSRAGVASGSTVKRGSSSGSVVWVAAAGGITLRRGAASGSTSRTGNATGAATHAGAASGGITRTGNATGSTTHRGATTGSVIRTGSASGETPVEGVREGSTAATLTRVGVATGNHHASGSTAGTRTLVGAATGATTRNGTANGTNQWAGAVDGDTIHPFTAPARPRATAHRATHTATIRATQRGATINEPE